MPTAARCGASRPKSSSRGRNDRCTGCSSGRHESATRADVDVLGELDGEPVLVREGRLLLSSFHPELTDDPRVHELFLDMVREEQHVGA